ncbi:MAG: alpha/beta hydrolase [Alphaproteobacteria bacterium]|jgi:dipeptidyl aminopeptidase/acylaminoacyl peptidase
MPFAIRLLLIFAAVYGLLLIGMFLFQRRLMYIPHKRLVSPHMDQSPVLEKVTLRTADGLSLKSWYAAPGKTKDGRLFPTILYLHGNTGIAADAAHKLIPMADAGFGIMLVEYRGYDGNPGKPTEVGLILDADAALHFIREKQGNNARVIYYGMSMGTGVANGLAVKVPPAAFIQEAGFTSFLDAGRQWYWFLPLSFLMKDTFQSRERIRSLKAPLLILHGEKDRTVHVSQAREMFKAAGTYDKEIKLYPEGRHTNLYDFGASDDILEWLYKKFPETKP